MHQDKLLLQANSEIIEGNNSVGNDIVYTFYFKVILRVRYRK